MKADIPSLEQWKKAGTILSLSAGSRYVKEMAEGFLRCGNCGQRQSLTPNMVEKYFREGWPICCAETLKGGTMGYYHDEEQMNREQAYV